MVTRKRFAGLFFAPFLLFPLPSDSREPGGAERVISWQDCIALAAAQNPDLRAALRAAEASRAQYRGSFNGILPRLSLSNSYSDSHTSSGGGSETWQAQGTATLDLINVNQWATIGSASASLRQNEANLQTASSSVLLALYKSFAALLYAQEEAAVAQSIRDLWTTNNQMIRLRYESGRESKGNHLRTDAERVQSEAALAQAVRDRRVAQRQLAQALGQDRYTALVVTGTWTLASLPSVPSDFDAMVDHLPAIRAKQAALEQARAAIHQAQSSLYPTLSLSYSRGTSGPSEFPTSPFWSFSGLISYPLFGGGPTSTFYASTAAQRAFDKAGEELRSARHQAITSLETAWAGLERTRDQVSVQRAFLEAATQRKKESDVMYRSGLMSFQDWQIVTTDYVNSKRNFLSAQQDVLLAEGQWRFAAGEQVGEGR